MPLFENPVRSMMDQMRQDMNPLAGMMSSQQRPEYRRPLPPWEAESVGKQLLQGGLSGLSYMASVFSKPGRAVRGAIDATTGGGHPSEALAFLPFSDSLGITDPGNAVEGVNLTDKMGLTDKKNDSWGRWGAGLAVDLATDPLSYIGGLGIKNSLNKSGQALEKAGLLKGITRTQMAHGLEDVAGKTPDVVEALKKSGHFVLDAADQAKLPAGMNIAANEPVAGLAKIGFPVLANFGKGPMATVGTGAAKYAAPVLDKLGNKILYSKLGVLASANLSPKAMDTTSAPLQQAARATGHATRAAAEQVGHGAEWDMLNEIAKVQQATGATPEEINRTVIALREMGRASPSLGIDPVLAKELGPAVGHLGKYVDEVLPQGQRLGLNLEDVNDKYVRYTPRQANVGEGLQRTVTDSKGRIFSARDRFSRMRQEPLRDLPGGQTEINRLSQDPRFLKGAATFATSKGGGQVIEKELATILGEEGKKIPLKLPKRARGVDVDTWFAGLNPAQQEAYTLRVKARLLASKLMKRSEARPIYSNDVVGNLRGYSSRVSQRMGESDAMLHAIAKGARVAEPGDIPLLEATHRLGLRTKYGDPKLNLQTEGAMPELYKRLYDLTGQTLDQAQLLPGTKKEWLAATDKYGLKPDVFKALSEQYFRNPHTTSQIAPIMNTIGKATDISKNALYSYWLPSHVRNLASGIWTNLTEGVGPGAMKKAYDLKRGYLPTAEQEDLARKVFSAGGVGGGINQTTDLSTAAQAAPHGVPMMAKPTGNTIAGDAARNAAGALRETVANPRQSFAMRGIAGAKEDNPILGGMKGLGTWIEDWLRSSHMIHNMGQGYSPEMAAELMKKAHFDYSMRGATSTERNYIKKLFPFWTFMSRNLPYQVGKAAHNPGLISNQLKMLTNSNPQQFIPEYLQSGVAKPLGPEVDGKQQFLGQVGLPIEEAFERWAMKNGRPDVAKTAMRYMAGMNPLLAGPLQWITDKQFYSGRNISDLKAPIGLDRYFDPETASGIASAIGMSPLSRVVSMAAKPFDQRKTWGQTALNMLTGLRVTDVDLSKLRAVETRDKLAAAMKHSPHLANYTEIYPRAGMKDQLTPEEITNLREMAYLQDQARKYMATQKFASGR